MFQASTSWPRPLHPCNLVQVHLCCRILCSILEGSIPSGGSLEWVSESNWSFNSGCTRTRISGYGSCENNLKRYQTRQNSSQKFAAPKSNFSSCLNCARPPGWFLKSIYFNKVFYESLRGNPSDTREPKQWSVVAIRTWRFGARAKLKPGKRNMQNCFIRNGVLSGVRTHCLEDNTKNVKICQLWCNAYSIKCTFHTHTLSLSLSLCLSVCLSVSLSLSAEFLDILQLTTVCLFTSRRFLHFVHEAWHLCHKWFLITLKTHQADFWVPVRVSCL